MSPPYRVLVSVGERYSLLMLYLPLLVLKELWVVVKFPFVFFSGSRLSMIQRQRSLSLSYCKVPIFFSLGWGGWVVDVIFWSYPDHCPLNHIFSRGC